MSADLPAAVMGSTTTVKTMSDGTLRVQVDIDPRHAKDAFSMFGAPGTPVALARIDPAAATEQDRRNQAEYGYGRHYAVLYRTGFFYNPRVCMAFGLPGTTPDAPDKIKASLYTAFDVESLADIAPDDFRLLMRKMQIEDALPKGFGE